MQAILSIAKDYLARVQLLLGGVSTVRAILMTPYDETFRFAASKGLL